MTDTQPESNAAFEQFLAAKNRASLVLAMVLGSILIPAFWVLDLYMVPEHLLATGIMRIFCTTCGVVGIGLSHWRRDWFTRNVGWMAPLYTAMVADSIAIMCWLQGGYESGYYAGIALVVISVGLLFVWPFRMALLFHLGVYGFYIAPLIVGLIPVQDVRKALNNQFFLLSFIVITLASQQHRYRMERQAFYANEALAATKKSLEEALDRLQELDRLKTRFFSNITHELRTPLTMILSPVEAMLSGDLGRFDPPQVNHLRAIWNNALRLLKLVNVLLDLAGLDERFLRLSVLPSRLPDLLREVVSYSRPLAARKDIELTLTIHDEPDDLHLDDEKMERVIVNLLSNALKFTEPGGRVDVELGVVDGEVCLCVRDTGIGIAEEQLDRIFERFSQGDDSTTRRFGGTGIGLAFAREIVDLHGGRITVESKPGQGSTFKVWLKRGVEHFDPEILDRRQRQAYPPDLRRAEDQEPREWTLMFQERTDYRFLEIDDATERRRVERTTTGPHSTKVLVVDDNVELLRFLHMQLQDEHEVFLAQDGEQALMLARREVPDAIVTDYMMPVLDGPALVRALRADPTTESIPVVMLTAKSTTEDRTEGRRAGADVYLSKPFSPSELRSAVNRLIERKQHETATVMRAHTSGLDMLAAGLAHELHNPLASVKSAWFMIGEASERLKKATSATPPDADAIAKQLRRIDQMGEIMSRAVRRIEHVVELVRSYARAGFAAEDIEVDVDQIVVEIADLLSPGKDGAALELKLEDDHARVKGSAAEIRTALGNIVQNALQAAGRCGHVRVCTERVDRHVVIQIADDGPGIAPEDLKRIFAPFFTTRSPGEGMGLGLVLAQHGVERAGGTIEVESVVGQGTTFRVRLPLSEGARVAR